MEDVLYRNIIIVLVRLTISLTIANLIRVPQADDELSE